MPNIYFQIDGAWAEARPVDFFYDYSGNGQDCILFIMPANMPFNILGMPVHVDYYTMHDPKAGTVGWVPHTNSPKSDLVKTAIPDGSNLLAIGEIQSTSIEDVLIANILHAAVAFAFIFAW